MTFGWSLFCYEDYKLSLQVRRDLQSDFVLFRSLPIKLVGEERIMVGLVLFFLFDDQLMTSERDRLDFRL